MKQIGIVCGIAFVISAVFLLAWCALDVGQEKKTVTEAHLMVKGFVIGFLLCFAAAAATLVSL